jgi:ornithine cyclodeaminase
MRPDLNLVPFVSVENMMRLVHRIGIEPFLRDLAGYIEDDIRRWERFDKSPRLASHSAESLTEKLLSDIMDL